MSSPKCQSQPAATAFNQQAPCEVQATLWRHCLKEYDYGPDRPRGACDKQRGEYYTCIKQWRTQTQAREYSHADFEMSPNCGHDAEMLHQCMMMNTFEVSQCRKEMARLKQCAAKNDPTIRKALEGDPDIVELEANLDNATGLRRLWYKAIGKL